MSNLKIVDNELPTIPCGSNFINVPLCYQETEYTCGVACIQSILARYGMYYRQSALADILHSQPILGTDIRVFFTSQNCLDSMLQLKKI
jgi:hypothetical protein